MSGLTEREAPRSAPELPSVEYATLPASLLGRGERRLEAEAYLSGGHGLRARVEAGDDYRRIGDIAEAWQPSRLKGIQVSETDGVPFLAPMQVFDIRPAVRKWVAPSKTPDLHRRFVDADWILVTCSGSVGDPIIAFGPHLEKVVSHDLLRLQVHDERDRGLLYTFLRSSVGRSMLRSSKYGSIVKHLEPEHIATVPVPNVDQRLRDTLQHRIADVYADRERAFRLTERAEQVYAECFPALPTADDEAIGYEVPASLMFGGRRRLDADYFNGDATAVERLLRANAPVEDLGSVVADIILPNRFKRIFVGGDAGWPYVSSELVFKINPEITKRIVHADRKDLAGYAVQRGWLMISRSGQTYGLFGSVVLANERHEGKVISEDIIRVVPKVGGNAPRSGYLALALSHPTLGRPLVLRLAFGASIPHLAPRDLAALPVPRLGVKEDYIADLMDEASDLRRKADDAEDEAVELLEAALRRDDRLKIDVDDPEDALRALLRTPRLEPQKRKRKAGR